MERERPVQVTRSLFGLRCLMVWFCIGTAASVPVQGGDIYVGASAYADRLNVLYKKVIDNTNPQNLSANRGQRLEDEASAAKFAYSYGFLAGYKVPLSVTGLYVAMEGDMLRHSGPASGSLRGAGTSAGRNQLGEVWPENWTLERNRSFGLTARAGAGIPFFGTWFGPSIYGLVGLRRLGAGFESQYSGCLTETACTEPEEFVSGSQGFRETFNGWTVGGGVETKAGAFSIRAELRITDYSAVDRVIRFDEQFVSSPLNLDPDSITLGISLLWYF